MHLQMRTKISFQKTSSSNCWNSKIYWTISCSDYWK